METTVNKQQILVAIQQAANDYSAVMLYSSKTHIQMQLSTRNMWDGLCDYFEKRLGWQIAAFILDELSIDAGFRVAKSCAWSYPFSLDGTEEIKTIALAPRLALLHKTLARLQNEQLNQTHT